MHERFTICLGTLPESGWRWRGHVARSLLMDASHGSVAPLQDLLSDAYWDACLQRKGDCYHLAGGWHLLARRQCSRCTVDFEWKVQGSTLRNYRIDQTRKDDDDEILAFPGKVDLLDVLREEIWLAWEPCVVCRPNCKGLCPGCGMDLNQGACGCVPTEETHPFAILRQLKI